MILSIAIAVISMLQTWLYLLQTPLGFVYPLVHNYEADYYWYLSLMRQGWEGNILLTTKYTPEIFPPQMVNTFFALTGMTARVLGISLPAMYALLRIAGGTGLLFASYKLLARLKLNLTQRLCSLCLIIFSSPFWFFENGDVRQAGEFWTGFDPILRITWLPHHTIANTIFISIILIFINVNNKLNNLFYIAVASLFAALINPAAGIILIMTLAIAIIITLCQNNIKSLKNSIPGIFSAVSGIVIAGIWLNRIQNSSFPWTAFRDWESSVQYPIDPLYYFMTLGITGVIALFAIVFVYREKSWVWNLVMGWYVAPLIGLFLVKYLPISNGRFLQGAYYIPAAILATYCINRLAGIITKKNTFSLWIPVSIIIAFSIPAWISSFNRQFEYIEKNRFNELVYVRQDTTEALNWLSNKKSGLVFAPGTISTMIPSYTGHHVLTGHPTFTYNATEKNSDLDIFYSYNYEGAKYILAKYKPDFVWFNGIVSQEEILGDDYILALKIGQNYIFEKNSSY